MDDSMDRTPQPGRTEVCLSVARFPCVLPSSEKARKEVRSLLNIVQTISESTGSSKDIYSVDQMVL
jgi:hypothetical protein